MTLPMAIWATECRDGRTEVINHTLVQPCSLPRGPLVAGPQTDVAINLEGNLTVVLGSLDHCEESCWINPECKGREASGSTCRR